MSEKKIDGVQLQYLHVSQNFIGRKWGKSGGNQSGHKTTETNLLVNRVCLAAREVARVLHHSKFSLQHSICFRC